MNRFIRLVLISFASGLLLFWADSASAAPMTFSCAAENTADCNGATYGISLSAPQALGGGNYLYQLTYGIDTTGYDWNATDYIRAVSFKNIVDNMSNLTLIDAPFGAEKWDIEEAGLNATGCKSPNGEEAACAEAMATLNGGYGAPVTAAGTQYFWTFSFQSTDATPNPTASIKYQYVTDAPINRGEFTKIGSLGSFETPVQTRVPEPGSLILFSTGLLALFARKPRMARPS